MNHLARTAPVLIAVLLLSSSLLASIMIVQRDVLRLVASAVFGKAGYHFLDEHLVTSGVVGARWARVLGMRVMIAVLMILLIPLTLIYVACTCMRYDSTALRQVATLLTNPLLNPSLECSWRNGLSSFERYPALAHQMQNKLFWNNLFIEAHVPTPMVVGYIIEGVVSLHVPTDLDRLLEEGTTDYLMKPVVGGRGRGIRPFDANTVAPSRGDYIIQKRIRQADGVASHLRIVTRWDPEDGRHETLTVALFVATVANMVQSNRATGAKTYEVDVEARTMRPMKEHAYIPLPPQLAGQILDDVLEAAHRAHARLPVGVATVSWDVMVSSDDVFHFLEGNVPGGTLFDEDVRFYERAVVIDSMIARSCESVERTDIVY